MNATQLSSALKQAMLPETYDASVGAVGPPVAALLAKQQTLCEIFLSHPLRYALAVVEWPGVEDEATYVRSVTGCVKMHFPYQKIGSYESRNVALYLILLVSPGLWYSVNKSCLGVIRDRKEPSLGCCLGSVRAIASLFVGGNRRARVLEGVDIRTAHFVNTESLEDKHFNAWGKPYELWVGSHIFNKTYDWVKATLASGGDVSRATQWLEERRPKPPPEKFAWYCPECKQGLRSSIECPSCGWLRYPTSDRSAWGKHGACPKCCFVYRWDGARCSHCGQVGT